MGKPLGLLAYLVLAPERTASRERLADLLWGDQERTAARHSVRRALSYVRAHLGPWVICADENSCTASSELRVDIDEFSSAIEAGRLSDALTLYRGDFLADFASPGAREFEAWADVERAYFRSKAVRTAEALCRDALNSGRFAEARWAAARLREVDSRSESGWRHVLETLMASGDYVGAVANAAKFEAWLESDERDPEPASRAAIKAAYRVTSPSTSARVDSPGLFPELVGREKEFRAVLEAWDRASGGSIQCLVITGGAGLGKTRLLESVSQRLRSMRKRVLVVRAFSGERTIPNAFAGALAFALAQLPGASGISAEVVPHLLELDPRLAEQFPGQEHHGPHVSGMSARSTALRELLGAVCDDAPLALMLDDAHWLDADSAQLLAGALARLQNVPLLLIVTSRSLPTRLDIEDRAIQLSVEPLTTIEVEALVASLGALPSNAEWTEFLVTRVTAASRGIPLLVIGALQELVAEGLLVLEQSTWVAPDEARLRERLRNINALATRLRALPPSAFRILLACSMAGRPLEPPLIDAITVALGSTDAEARQELEHAGYLRQTDAGVEVSHDAVAETAIQIAAPDVQTAVARTLGIALSATQSPALAEHAIRHLSPTRDLDAIVPALTIVVRAHRRSFNSAPRDFVARQLGVPAGDVLARAALARLPKTLFSRRSRIFAGATVAAALSLSLLAAARLEMKIETSPALEVVLPLDHSRARIARVELDPAASITSEPVSLRFADARADSLQAPAHGTLVVPGEDAWAAEVQSADTGGTDVAIVDSHRHVLRVTWSHADEAPASWSPDGKQLALTTSGLSAAGFRTAAIYDRRSGTVHGIGGTDLPVAQMSWSRDGTRLAFIALPLTDTRRFICVADADGEHRRCRTLGVGVAELAGWLSEYRLLLRLGTPVSLYSYDVRTDEMNRLGVDSVDASDLSPDGEWIAYAKRKFGIRQLYIAPSRHLESARALSAPQPLPLDAVARWRGLFAQRPYLASVSIDAPNDSVDIGNPVRLTARGISSDGRVIPVNAQRWKTSDPRVATVDSSGELQPVAPGTVEIDLSAGGWRRARRSFVVRRGDSPLVLRETWNAPFVAWWVPFGSPLPLIVRDSILGDAFLNNGDGWYFSGAYLARALDARRGIAVDATLRTPITKRTEQYLEISIVPVHGIAELRSRWDHRTGYFPYREVASGGLCTFGYPDGEDVGSRLRARPIGPLALAAGGSLPALARGTPRNLRLQLFPDGICGVALEGEKPWLSGEPIVAGDSVIVLIQGNSVGTSLRVGPVTIRRGVPGGVDWLGKHRGR